METEPIWRKPSYFSLPKLDAQKTIDHGKKVKADLVVTLLMVGRGKEAHADIYLIEIKTGKVFHKFIESGGLVAKFGAQIRRAIEKRIEHYEDKLIYDG